MSKPDPDRAWQQALDVHAHSIISAALDQPDAAGVVLGDDLGGRPTVEILGPDGVWRRYYVRLTPTGTVLP
jgi:hypothetical protein